jgi:hypothetical protein
MPSQNLNAGNTVVHFIRQTGWFEPGPTMQTSSWFPLADKGALPRRHDLYALVEERKA